jgi:hypothetical protein
MLVKDKSKDILGINFECKEDPPRIDCPNLVAGPEGFVKIEKTGEYQCITCFRKVGVESTTDDERADDDVIDEENAVAVEHVFTAEGDKIQDHTTEEGLVIDRKDKITEIISRINMIDHEFARFLSENQDDIIDVLREMETAGAPNFETNLHLIPKILGVATHLMKRYPYTKAMKELRVKFSMVEVRKNILDELNSPEIGNEVSRAINSIGQTLDVPEAIVMLAVEEYDKQRPPNKEPKTQPLGAAWLYIYAKKSNFRINKTGIYNLPGVSRAAFNKAVESYEKYFRNLKGSLEESKTEEK